jgi:hypothetical protein
MMIFFITIPQLIGGHVAKENDKKIEKTPLRLETEPAIQLAKTPAENGEKIVKPRWTTSDEPCYC